MSESNQVALVPDVDELRALRRAWRNAAQPVVLVPTMGDLHAGHLQLVRMAASFGQVLVSIFVNPTQFGPNEDFASYPRDLAADMQRLRTLGTSVAVFAPPQNAIYADDSSTWVEVTGVSEPLCGAFRPGHFRGVATVVAKLFGLTQPDMAVFGEKDAQQCLILRQMVRDLQLPIELLFCPTVREADGLAMSSRNRYLQAEQRREATRLWAALSAGERALQAGERLPSRIEAAMCEAAGGLQLDYAELRSLPALERPERGEGALLLAIAARIGQARLIDNLPLAVSPRGVERTPLLIEQAEPAVRARLRGAGWILAGEAR